MHGDGDLAQLAVVPAGHEENVKTLLQNAPSVVEASQPACESSGPEFQAKF
jgi:hypothetical protein